MAPKPTYDELARRVEELEARLAAEQPSDLGRRILERLFQEWETSGPPGIVDVKTLALELEASLEQIRDAAAEHFADGAIDRDRTQSALYLTPEGYDRLSRPARR
jgi:hypothetical protein